MIGILAWLNGRKMALGLAVTLLASLAETVPPLVEALGGDAVGTARVIGAVLAAVGAIHKVVKGR